jgi:hypothetical protein
MLVNTIKRPVFIFTVIAICSMTIQARGQSKPEAPSQSTPPASKNAAPQRVVASPSRQAGVVVVKDADTGQLRQATPEEIGALVGGGVQSAQPLAIAPTAVVRPDGFTSVTLGPDQMSFSVITKTADGKLVQSCVTGEDAAKKAVNGVKQPVPNRKERLDEK